MWTRLFPWKYPIALAGSFADDLIILLWLWNLRRCSWKQHCLGLASVARFAGTLITSASGAPNLWIYQWTNPLSAGLLALSLAGWAPRASRGTVVSVGALGIVGYFAIGAFVPSTHVFADANEVVLAASAIVCAIITLSSMDMRQRSLWGPGVWTAIGTFWFWGAAGIARAFANPVYEADPNALRILFNVRNVFQICGTACWMAALPGRWQHMLRRSAVRESLT